jgi:peptidoglycan hydrolase CwlO-like protein
MEILEIIKELLKEYDILTLTFIGVVGIVLYNYLNKLMSRLKLVDNAVNCREHGAPTLSQEVSEIHRKVDVLANEIDHIKQDVIEHREEDEVIIKSLTKDIEDLNSKLKSRGRKPKVDKT